MTVLLALALLLSAQRPQPAMIGANAPGFTVRDDRGVTRSLTDFRGKYVVLEWHEKGCPYVTKHYRSGAMQKLQTQWRARGVEWLLVNSSEEGAHSYLTQEESRTYFEGLETAHTAALLDTNGTMGKVYGVTTALHMVIINPAGKMVYNGAIDDQPRTEASSLLNAKNYVSAALAELLAGRPVTTPTSEPYGCAIHYAAGR